METSQQREVLLHSLEETGIEVACEQLDMLARHLWLVLERNRTLNLTRIDSWEDGCYLHVADSLLLLDAFARAPRGAFVDMGTGAGFPGIPLAIVTGRPATLVDSVRKKAAAVDDFLGELGLRERVRADSRRVEDLAREERGRYAVVCARAVAQTNVLVEYAAPLLRGGGRLVVAKARPSDEEIACADRAAKICGLARVSRETFELPGDRGHREVLCFERVGKPSVKLPRATGMARKKPLGA